MRDDETRSVFGAVGSGVLGVAIGLAILAVGFAVSRVALPDSAVVAASVGTAAPTQARVVASSSPVATVAPSPTRTLAPTPTATPARTPTPAPTADPMVVTAYQGQGLRLAAIAIPSGYTFTTPIGGKVSIELYQWADGQIRTGLDGQPTYPYIYVTSADRKIKLRPGVIDRDVQMLVKDGDTVSAGTPLFRTITTGASSWATFYDASVTAQVVASAAALPANVEVDPVPIFKR